MWKKRPSKNVVIFLTASSILVSAHLFDRFKANKIRNRIAAAAKERSELPQPTLDPVRSLTVYLSAVDENAGSINRHTYYKPIFDAAALDCEVVEAWAWYDDLRTRVSKNIFEFNESETSSLEYGMAALGRSAWKGVVMGVNDAMDANDLIDRTKVPPKPRSGWFQFFSWFQEKEKEVKMIQYPAIGFLPNATPQNWWLRLFKGWWNERDNVEKMCSAALAVVIGNVVPMDQLFPGNLLFTLDAKELNADGKGIVPPAVKNSEIKSSGTVEEHEVKSEDLALTVTADPETPLLNSSDAASISKPPVDDTSSEIVDGTASKFATGDNFMVGEHSVKRIRMYHSE